MAGMPLASSVPPPQFQQSRSGEAVRGFLNAGECRHLPCGRLALVRAVEDRGVNVVAGLLEPRKREGQGREALTNWANDTAGRVGYDVHKSLPNLFERRLFRQRPSIDAPRALSRGSFRIGRREPTSPVTPRTRGNPSQTARGSIGSWPLTAVSVGSL